MKIQCPNCNNYMDQEFGRYKYVEAGLDNVILDNIKMFNCKCGVSIPSILRLKELNNLIAEKLLLKAAILDGNEIKFLRKNIPISAKHFAQLIGVEKTTYSKWENGRQDHRAANDRLIRILYMNLKQFDHNYIENFFKITKNIRFKKKYCDFLIRAELIDDEYLVSILPPIADIQKANSLFIEIGPASYGSAQSEARALHVYSKGMGTDYPFFCELTDTETNPIKLKWNIS